MNTAKQIEQLKQLLTGNRKSDRLVIFKRIDEAVDHNETEVLNECMRIAVNYMPNNPEDMMDEFSKYEETYTIAFIHITLFQEVSLFKRISLMNYLIKYVTKKEEIERTGETPLYSFDSPFQKQLFDKLTGNRFKYTESTYPYYLIYSQYAMLLTEYGDNANAYQYYSKAHVTNPMSTEVLFQLLILFKQSRQSEDLFRLGQWMINVASTSKGIAHALQMMAYSLYLDGKFEESYAFYFQSLKYDENPFPGLNDEINGVLTALKRDDPYNLSKVDISNLFIGKTYKPQPNELVYDVMREYIIVEFTKQNYLEVLNYTNEYMKIRPRDTKVSNIHKKALEALN